MHHRLDQVKLRAAFQGENSEFFFHAGAAQLSSSHVAGHI